MQRLENKILYYYNRWFYADPDWSPIPPDCKCKITDDKSVFASVKCVIFNLPSLSLSRDLLILPHLYWRKHPAQIWVIESMESAANYPLLDNPSFLQMFNYQMTYKQNADVWTPYLDECLLLDLRKSFVKPKKGFCAAFISSGLNRSGREKLVSELMEYIPIDSYGKFMQNQTLVEDKGRETKLEVISQYHFTLAFENSICPDYVTEKFYEPLIAGSIPVYLGAPNVSEFSPGENAYINAADFSSAQDLADFLKNVNESGYHVWRKQSYQQSFLDKVARKNSQHHAFNTICDLVLETAASPENI